MEVDIDELLRLHDAYRNPIKEPFYGPPHIYRMPTPKPEPVPEPPAVEGPSGEWWWWWCVAAIMLACGVWWTLPAVIIIPVVWLWVDAWRTTVSDIKWHLSRGDRRAAASVAANWLFGVFSVAVCIGYPAFRLGAWLFSEF